MLADSLDDSGDGQADDVFQGSLDPLDESTPVVLGRIRPGLVERIDVGEVGLDHGLIQRPERDAGGFDKEADLSGTSPDKTDAGQDLVNASRESAQHLGGMLPVAGLAEDFPIEHDHGVGAQDKLPSTLRRHMECLPLGIGDHQIPWGKAPRQFLDVRGPDDDFETGPLQQITTSRRGGGEDNLPREGTA